MTLGEAFQLREPGIERHGRVPGILCQIQVCSPSQLFLDDQCLFEQFEAARQELVLDLKEVAFALVSL